MRKEALFAIFIGIIVGLGLTYGIYRIRQVITPPPAIPTNQTQLDILQEENAEETTEKLFITVPEDGHITNQDTITASGNADPNELIVMLVHDDQYITKSDDIGSFAQEISLERGGNIIQVIAITPDGKQKKKQILVAREETVKETTIESTSSAKPEEK